MNWISALSPWQWLLMAAIPPAVLSLYFLKLKRQEMVISSTLLWRRALEDIHVNSLWQRLRKNLLLYLQLLFLGLLILACLRPGWNGLTTVGERRIYIIDNSASMQADDESPSRLEVAKKKVRQLIAQSSSSDASMIIAFSDRADVRQGFTTDQNRLLSAVDSIRATHRNTDISEALRAAAGLANPPRVSFGGINDVPTADAVAATAYILSDGGFKDVGDVDVGKLAVKYYPIGKEGTPNVGIVNFAVQRNEEKPDQLQAFARIINYSGEKIELTPTLELNGKLLDAQSCTVPAASESGVVFQLQSVQEGTLKLDLDFPDALLVDNVAYAAIRPPRQINVLLVTPGNNALEVAAKTGRVSQLASVRIESPSFLEDPAYVAASSDSNFDLIIYDQCSPKSMPQSNTLFFGSMPPEDINPPAKKDAADTIGENTRWQFGSMAGASVVMDVNRTNPITEYLEMGAVVIAESRSVKPPESGTVLLTGDSGPLLAVAPRGAYQDAVLGFAIIEHTDEGVVVNTDWGIRRSFPVFVYSAIEYLGGGVTEASAPSVQPGWGLGLQLSNRFRNFRVVSPKGETTELTRGEDSRYVFTKTDDIGVYQVYAEGLTNPVEVFCSNLFSSTESDLTVGQEIKMGYEKVAATQNRIRARQETWQWILLLGLGLLMMEWIVFNRRILV